MYIPQEIIRKKRDGNGISKEEIRFMIDGFVKGSVPDYQMAALAMAIFLKGFSTEETAHLLQAMIDSGERFNWSSYKGERTFVDKHSTGGVGDKSSLVILPLLIADGLDVPMVAGRGLGHTGGTLDKLEAIPGFSPFHSTEKFRSILHTSHGFFAGQTNEFVPADKKLYALRDVTSTVESQALIIASIMSKKLAEGLNALVLDVKFGSGAFMSRRADAEALAKGLAAAGRAAGCTVEAALTNMDEPLGRMAGNSLEVVECLDLLQGKDVAPDTLELSLALAARLSAAARGNVTEKTVKEARERMTKALSSGRAFEIFTEIAVQQGAKAADVERKNTDWIHGNSLRVEIPAPQEGFVSAIDTRGLGIALLEMGGGRKRSADAINPYVGFTHLAKVGETKAKGEPLCVVYLDPASPQEELIQRVKSCFTWQDASQGAAPAAQPLVAGWI